MSVRSLLYVLGITLVAALGYGVVVAALQPMPSPVPRGPSILYSVGDKVIATFSPEGRIPIPYREIPWTVRDAVVATEDRTFWTNLGVDPKSVVRAALVDLLHHGIYQGGSTITQQLAKNLFLTESRTLTRKFLELFLALRLTATYTKRQILTMYLNTIYFGEGAWGIERAAETYFGVHAWQLNLPQAALLAGLIASPSAFDPYLHPQAARLRRAVVLQNMVAAHYISERSAELAARAPLGLAPRSIVSRSSPAPYFVDYVLGEIGAKDPALYHAIAQGGYRIYTTLNLRVQRAADQAMASAMPPARRIDGVPEPEGAIVALNPYTGGIEAMVGGRNYALTPFNRAVDAYRQAGSSFKPFLYAALFQSGEATAASIMADSPIRFPNGHGGWYVPHNDTDRYYGPMIPRRALMISDNVVAIKWTDLLGPDRVIAMARALGITSPLPDNLTISLGSASVSPLEMAAAYAAFDNGGYAVTPFAVRKIVDPYGDVVYEESPSLRPVLSPQVAFILTDLLKSVFAPEGTAAGLNQNLNFQVAGKTGTSNDAFDGWFVGYSSDLVASVWVGYDRPTRSLSGYGSATAGPVWADFMARAENPYPPPDFQRPPGLVRRPICTLDGLLANPTCPVSWEYFVRGTEPTEVSPIQYTGPTDTRWPDARPWYYRYHGPIPGNPLWNELMDFKNQGY